VRECSSRAHPYGCGEKPDKKSEQAHVARSRDCQPTNSKRGSAFKLRPDGRGRLGFEDRDLGGELPLGAVAGANSHALPLP